MRVDHLGPVLDLPKDDVDDVDGHANVAGDELVDLELGDKGREAVEDDDEHGDEEGNVGAPGQQRVAVGQGAARDPLRLHAPDHADVADEDGDPVERAKDRHHGHKVAKHLGRVRRHVQVA